MTYTYFEPGPYQFVTTDLTHNLIGDLLRRTGLVGVVRFVAAVAFSGRDGLKAWRYHVDARAAGLALGCVAALAGILAKGMVESLFEKYRLATLMGLLFGIVR